MNAKVIFYKVFKGKKKAPRHNRDAFQYEKRVLIN